MLNHSRAMNPLGRAPGGATASGCLSVLVATIALSACSPTSIAETASPTGPPAATSRPASVAVTSPSVATTYERVRRDIVEILGVDVDQVTPNARLVDDLAADSLDLVELTLTVETEFSVSIPDADCSLLKTVQDIVDYVNEHPASSAIRVSPRA
jgi:acyl carrier protein